MAKIVRSVHVTDPDRPGLSVLLEAGQTVPDHLAGQITNPDVWEDGKLPAAAKDAEDSGADDGDEEKSDTKQAAPAAKKTAAKKAAAAPARGRTAAGEGTSGN